jgi:hypothetical protein
MMKTAGLVIDDWKLPIFKKHLEKAHYSYSWELGPTKGTMLLKVPYEWVAELKIVVDAANKECVKRS